MRLREKYLEQITEETSSVVDLTGEEDEPPPLIEPDETSEADAEAAELALAQFLQQQEIIIFKQCHNRALEQLKESDLVRLLPDGTDHWNLVNDIWKYLYLDTQEQKVHIRIAANHVPKVNKHEIDVPHFHINSGNFQAVTNVQKKSLSSSIWIAKR